MRPVLSLQSSLDKLQEDIGKTLEKVSSREKYINNQLEPLIQEYCSAQAKLSEVRMDFKPSPLSQCVIYSETWQQICVLHQAKERYQQASAGVTERTRVLAEVSEHIMHLYYSAVTSMWRKNLR